MAADVSEVGLRYLRLAGQVRRQIDERLMTGRLSLSRLKLLQAVDGLGPVNQAGLAGQLGKAPRSVTQAVDALERQGLVRRSPSATDRRAKMVTLTPAGTAALSSGLAAGNEALRQAFGGLGAARLAALAALLDVIDEHVGTEYAPHPAPEQTPR
ncbi:MarR family winged helix-turn-helix transcriptional regulator [Streptomyces sp. KR55]|uniref:MarR family winged helix-turn-helix transcriptional regulator n=1 Tax=Streptomyces sp. KR55 TaxID=3457425 RepID=UPI003FD50657